MNRSNFSKQRYDFVVIGGGISGAAVAYDAALRGFSVALIEREDFGSKTSAATSKLIHGGLRYLANFELSLVRESLRERRILENIAPNFVYPIANMVITDRKSFSTMKSTLKIGMILYDILSFDKKWTWDKSKKIPCHSSLSREETLRREPSVEKEDLTGSVVYYDCASIFPERLTLAFIKSAVAHGADVANYMEARGFLFSGDRISGVKVYDRVNNREIELYGDLVINCAGPWADRVLSLTGKNPTKEELRRSEGIHIITKKLTEKHLVTAVTPSGRHIFIIPWRGYSLIGTTDKEYFGSPDDWRVTHESILELIEEVNHSFSDKIRISYDDVVFYYGGLRPLVETESKEDVYNSSRKYEIFDNKEEGVDGLITVEGGKYTTSRNLAQKVIDFAIKKTGKKFSKSLTAKKYLTGSEIKDIENFVLKCKDRYREFNGAHIDYLARIYGTELDSVMNVALSSKNLSQALNNDGEMLAQVIYAIKEEMAVTLSDILLRRTGIGTLGHPGKEVLQKVADIAAELLKWNDQQKEEEIKKVENIFKIP